MAVSEKKTKKLTRSTSLTHSLFPLRIISTLSHYQHTEGGFCGGPSQLPHLAPTYASVNTLAILGSYSKKALTLIHRSKMKGFLMSLKCSNDSVNQGGWVMHEGGEVDVR